MAYSGGSSCWPMPRATASWSRTIPRSGPTTPHPWMSTPWITRNGARTSWRRSARTSRDPSAHTSRQVADSSSRLPKRSESNAAFPIPSVTLTRFSSRGRRAWNANGFEHWCGRSSSGFHRCLPMRTATRFWRLRRRITGRENLSRCTSSESRSRDTRCTTAAPGRRPAT